MGCEAGDGTAHERLEAVSRLRARLFLFQFRMLLSPRRRVFGRRSRPSEVT
jgi:hypothetical protein